MRFQKISSVVFAFLSLAAGCAQDPAQETKTASYWRGIDRYNGMELNGVNLNGSTFLINGVNFNGVNLNGVNLNGVNLNGYDLRGTLVGDSSEIGGVALKNSRLVGVMDGDYEMPMQIMDVVVDSQNSSNPNLYYVSFILTDENDEIIASYNPCGQDDENNEVPAIFVNGVWDAYTGNRSDSSTMITLACTNAAIGKCALWGYHPWDTHREYPGATPSPAPSDCVGENASLCKEQSLADWHQACTRMVRADYCGNGTPHTRNGTHINVWDNFDIQTHGSPGPEYLMEAEWTQSGAKCIQRTRWVNAAGTGMLPDLNDIQTNCPERLYTNDTLCSEDAQCGSVSGACRLDVSSDSENRKYCDCAVVGCASGFSCNTTTHHCVTNDTSCTNPSTSDFNSAYGYSVPAVDASTPRNPLLDRRLLREETRDNDSL